MFSIVRRLVRGAVKAFPTLLTLVALGGVAWWGTQNDWRLPSAAAPASSGPRETDPIRVSPGPPDNPTVRARITFESADDVRRAGLQFAPVRTQTLTRSITATGSVGYCPALYTQLSARAAGTVWWVEKVPGEPVAKDEVLALVEAVEVGKAKTELASAIRQLEKQITTLEQLRAVGGAVAGRTVLEAQAAVDDARFRVVTAQQALLNLGLDIRYQELQLLSVEDRLTRLQFLGLPAEFRERIRGQTQSANLLPVTAPFAGAMVRRTTARGETVTVGKPLFVVAAITQVHLELALDPADARAVRLGLEVRFTPEADPEFEARGVLAHLVPEVDDATRKIWAHAEVDNPGGRLRPNSFGRGRVIVAEVPAATVVPESAVQPDGEEWVAFVRNGDAAFEARRVRPGLRGGGFVEVTGVALGEEVVTTGSHALLAELQRDKIAAGGRLTVMLAAILDWSIRHRGVVLGAALALTGLGVYSLPSLPVDAFPDPTPVQVQVNTYAPNLSPEEVETQITVPIEQAITGLPKLQPLRSISKFGLSQVVVTFDDSVNIYFARQLISERLQTVQFPANVIDRPQLGPVATGLGEVFHYTLWSPTRSLPELRTLQDWTLRPRLRTVPGVAEVNGWGGAQRQYVVRADPDRLQQHGMTLNDLLQALTDGNRNAGGGRINGPGSEILVQGRGRTNTPAEVSRIVLRVRDGVPVRVADVARVEVGIDLRTGAVTADGRGEVVLGLGFTLMGENSHAVTTGLRDKLDETAPRLPPDVKVVPVYERTELVNQVIGTVKGNLFEGGLLVVAVLFIFLGNLRAGLVVAAAIPLSMLFAFAGMLQFGIAASLLSLGALDFGLVVDSSVVMVENIMRRLSASKPQEDRTAVLRDAVSEVRGPTLFGELIIMTVYIPILALEGVEGKFFRPMALTVIFALVGSLVLSLTVMPALASVLLPRRVDPREPFLVRAARWLYRPVLQIALSHRFAVLLGAAAVLVASVVLARGLGSEFVPRLSEGALVVGVVRLPGTSLEESVRANTQMERILRTEFPDEVAHVWGRCGTAGVATDPMGPEETDMFITLKPRSEWKRAKTQDELVGLIKAEFDRLPGQTCSYTQPIEQRVNEMISGVKTDVAVEIYGDDFNVLKDLGDKVAGVLATVPGCEKAVPDQLTGQPVLEIQLRQERLARYGLSARTVLEAVEAIGGKTVGDVLEGEIRIPLVVRLPENWRARPETVGAVQVTAPGGERVPLSFLADIRVREGPAKILRADGQRRLVVQCNVRNRDLGGFVAETQRRVANEVPLPGGRYRVRWGGQFENLQRAEARLMIAIPAALAIILLLLYLTFGRIAEVLLVFATVPLAAAGGVAALWIRGLPFSVSAGVGFIALSGVATLNGMVLVSFIRHLRERGVGLDAAVEEAAIERLRPVLMTALVASLGFIPMALNTGVGAEVQRPLATVVIGGILSSTLLTLLVLPVLYDLFGRWLHEVPAHQPGSGAPEPSQNGEPAPDGGPLFTRAPVAGTA